MNRCGSSGEYLEAGSATPFSQYGLNIESNQLYGRWAKWKVAPLTMGLHGLESTPSPSFAYQIRVVLAC